MTNTVLEVMNYIDPALVEEVKLDGKKRRMSASVRVGLIAACVCLGLVGTGIAAEVMGVRIANFLPGGEEQAHYDVLLDGVEAVPVDGLSEDILAASFFEPIDFAAMQEIETALGMELSGFLPFEEGAYRDQLHFRIDVGENEGPMHHTHCTLSTNGPEGNPSIIQVTAKYRTYPPQQAVADDNMIHLTVTAYLYTESGLARHSEQLGMRFKDSELTLRSFMAADGQEIPIVSDTHPVTVNDENGMPVDMVVGNSVYAYYVQDGVLYSVMVSGGSAIDKEELQPALESILGGLSA